MTVTVIQMKLPKMWGVEPFEILGKSYITNFVQKTQSHKMFIYKNMK